MTKDEALTLVLDALENHIEDPRCDNLIEKLITAIKAALEAKDEPVFHKPHLNIEGPLHVVCRCPACKAQPQRTWVGLTEEDLKPICDEWRIVYGAWMDDFAKDIETKLKEKNT